MLKNAPRIGTTILVVLLFLAPAAVVQADINQFTGPLGICDGVTIQDLIAVGNFYFLNREQCQIGNETELLYQFQAFSAPDPATSFSFGIFPANVPVSVSEFSPGAEPAGFSAADSSNFTETMINGVIGLASGTTVGTFPVLVLTLGTQNLVRDGTISLTSQDGITTTFSGFEEPVVQVADVVTPEPGYFTLLLIAVPVLFRYRRRAYA
jgi:hypothetical protein